MNGYAFLWFCYRAGKGQLSDSIGKQLEQMASALESAHAESRKLSQELGAEKSAARRRHTSLVEELTKATQARDEALAALKRMQAICIERGVDMAAIEVRDFYLSFGFPQNRCDNVTSFLLFSPQSIAKDVQSHVGKYTRASSERTADGRGDERRAIDTLRRGYLEADEELEAERRAHRRAKASSDQISVVSAQAEPRRNLTAMRKASYDAAPLPTPLPPPSAMAGGISAGLPVNLNPSIYSTPNASSSTRAASGSLRVARASDNGEGGGVGGGRVRGTTKILLHKTGVVDVESVVGSAVSEAESEGKSARSYGQYGSGGVGATSGGGAAIGGSSSYKSSLEAGQGNSTSNRDRLPPPRPLSRHL